MCDFGFRIYYNCEASNPHAGHQSHSASCKVQGHMPHLLAVFFPSGFCTISWPCSIKACGYPRRHHVRTTPRNKRRNIGFYRNDSKWENQPTAMRRKLKSEGTSGGHNHGSIVQYLPTRVSVLCNIWCKTQTLDTFQTPKFEIQRAPFGAAKNRTARLNQSTIQMWILEFGSWAHKREIRAVALLGNLVRGVRFQPKSTYIFGPTFQPHMDTGGIGSPCFHFWESSNTKLDTSTDV